MAYDDNMLATGAYYYNELGFAFAREVFAGDSIYCEIYNEEVLIPYIKNFCLTEKIKVMYVPFFITVDKKFVEVKVGIFK